jgi:hypothetical protein
MANMQTYGAAEFTCNLGGIEIDQSALGPDDFLKLTQNTKAFKLRSGIGGGKTRSQTKHPDYTLTIKIRQTDPTNTLLSALHNLDKLTSGGSGIVPCYVKDRLGNLAIIETEAFIDGDPEFTAGAEEGDLEWTVILPSPNVLMGGH